MFSLSGAPSRSITSHFGYYTFFHFGLLHLLHISLFGKSFLLSHVDF